MEINLKRNVSKILPAFHLSYEIIELKKSKKTEAKKDVLENCYSGILKSDSQFLTRWAELDFQ